MATIAFLNALQSYLDSVGLAPSPKGIGVTVPAKNNELPAVVLSLDELVIPSPGLGEHTEVVSGALAATSEIDLANPVLPGDTGLSLLSPDRRTLTLYHGGLVDKGGSNTPLGADDISVKRNGNAFTVVGTAPGNGEVSVSPAEGQLIFGKPLPASGTLIASYFIGQWERRVVQLGGQLELSVIAGNNNDAESLSNRIIDVMAQASANINGLRQLVPVAVGPVSDFSMGASAKRQRHMRWRFDYEHILDQAESSGGIIHRIKLRSQTESSLLEEEDIT